MVPSFSIPAVLSPATLVRRLPPVSVDKSAFAGAVLVVDDQKINRRLVSRFVGRVLPMATVDVAEDGQEAVDMVMSEGVEYAVVFMDIQMPRMTGVEATRVLRERGFSAPIIAVTGGTLEEEIEGYKAAGMDDVIHKPCKQADFEEMLDEYWARVN